MTTKQYGSNDDGKELPLNVKTKKIKKDTKIIKKVLKPHGIATWILTNYPKITILQISQFCGLDQLKIGFLKEELEKGKKYPFSDPIIMGYTYEKDLEESSKYPHLPIAFYADNTLDKFINKKNNKRTYISFKEKKDQIAAALWIINYAYSQDINIEPEDVKSLIPANIINIRKLFNDRKYVLSIVPLDPIQSQLCTKQSLEEMLKKCKIKNIDL